MLNYARVLHRCALIFYSANIFIVSFHEMSGSKEESHGTANWLVLVTWSVVALPWIPYPLDRVESRI